MRPALIGLALSFVLAATAAKADDLWLVQIDNTFATFIDAANITSGADGHRIATTYAAVKSEQINASYMRMVDEYDCSRRVARSLTVALYDTLDRPKREATSDGEAWKAPQPGTVSSSKLRFVCQTADERSKDVWRHEPRATWQVALRIAGETLRDQHGSPSAPASTASTTGDLWLVNFTDTSASFVDASRITIKPDGHRTAWNYTAYKSEQDVTGHKFYYSQILLEYDCAARTELILSTVFYATFDKVAFSLDYNTGKPSQPKPNTMAQTVVQFVCATQDERNRGEGKTWDHLKGWTWQRAAAKAREGLLQGLPPE